MPGRALVVVDSLQLAPRPAPAPGWTSGSSWPSGRSRRWRSSGTWRCSRWRSCRGIGRDRPDPRPTLDDLGALGAIKQSADLVLGIYREEMYRPGQGVEGATELIVAKNRNGPTGFVDLFFYPRMLRFEDMLDPA